MKIKIGVLLLTMVALSCSKEDEDNSPATKPSSPDCFQLEDYTQQLPNMSFDSWGFPDSSDGAYQDPCGAVWTSSNAISNSFITQSTVLRTASADDGEFAAQVETKSFLGTVIFPGVLFTGRFKSYTFNIADALSDVEFGVPFTEKPKSMAGLHKYTSIADDEGYMAVLLSRYDQTNKKKDTVGFGEYTASSSVELYSPFSLTIDYASYSAGNEIPDSVVVIFTSSKGFQDLIGSAGSKLTVDKCSFVY